MHAKLDSTMNFSRIRVPIRLLEAWHVQQVTRIRHVQQVHTMPKPYTLSLILTLTLIYITVRHLGAISKKLGC